MKLKIKLALRVQGIRKYSIHFFLIVTYFKTEAISFNSSNEMNLSCGFVAGAGRSNHGAPIHQTPENYLHIDNSFF
jgi:hypothetical protein